MNSHFRWIGQQRPTCARGHEDRMESNIATRVFGVDTQCREFGGAGREGQAPTVDTVVDQSEAANSA